VNAEKERGEADEAEALAKQRTEEAAKAKAAAEGTAFAETP